MARDLDRMMFNMIELFEECEADFIEDKDFEGLDEFHEWFSKEYTFDKSFDEMPWYVDIWAEALEGGDK